MKKFFRMGFAVAATLTMINVNAQLSVGIKVGTNFSKFNTSDDFVNKTKTGLVFGGFAAYTVIPRLDVQVEALYSGMGAKEDPKYGGSYNFNYIQLPVSARYSVWDKIYVVTGPQLGLLLSAKTKNDGQSTDIKENVKTSDISWMIGAGYEWPVGLSADFRFIPGLNDISKNENSIKNTAFRLTVGYRLWRGK